ncbi:MAG: putative baseplate assembly protein [Gammaproteobacteria bacterium]|nr:putative baseplate assembly protein [Gammaproteobacteria bacterium]MCF6230878.1 putative baseplate assembly protein [Gammaproteobacteria bacterium]
MSALICHNVQRRERVRQHRQLNGIDYLEVSHDQLTLTVYFLGKAPLELEIGNIRIEGGRRIRDVSVKMVRLHTFSQIEFDDYMEVEVDKPGDFSAYTLRVVEKSEVGEWQPHSDFDPRYDQITFNFKAGCPSDLDCKQVAICPPDPKEEPDINYLAKDYTSLRQLILDRLALVMPQWNERHVPDIGMALVEVLAYVGDHLSYYQDAVATEAYLDTARKRISVRRHARLVDYPMHEGCNARTWLCIESDGDFSLPSSKIYFVTNLHKVLPNSKSVLLEDELHQIPSSAYEIFEPMARQSREQVQFYRDHSRIGFYTWGDDECCLPRGTTRATLRGVLVTEQMPPQESCESVDKGTGDVVQRALGVAESTVPKLHLKVGDVLIFEEVMGPKTGHPGDVDPNHRHAVRLIAVETGVDPLNEEPVVEISWAEEDALPFPLCLSALGPPPACELLHNISIACGNVILVDHGKTVDEDLGKVPTEKLIECCQGAGVLADSIAIPKHYSPRLGYAALTFSEPLVDDLPALHLLKQDVRRALPQITLTASYAMTGDVAWSPQGDLLGSDAGDRHFIVEIDNDGYAQLRFGKGGLGRQPDAGTAFQAVYRIGAGVAGNVGSGAISHLVMRNTQLSGVSIQVRNPFAAQGGVAPEPISEVKLFAPHTFRKKLQRAIIADDYAAIVQREFRGKVQRAAARLRWTGSWYEVLVAVDPYGEEEADAALLDAISKRLHRYRRIGHDLVVKPARRVPLDIELSICVSPGYLRGHVKMELLGLFSNRMLAGGQGGFFHVDNLTFGDDLYLSQLVATAQAVTGVESVRVIKLQRLNEPPNREIESGVLPLGPFEIARLDNDPGFPENGKLTLDMRGGR